MLTDNRQEQERHANRLKGERRIVSAWGSFIRELLTWDWLVTITFRLEPNPAWAISKIQRYLRDLEKAANHAIGWLAVEDFGRTGGRYHFHILVAGVLEMSEAEWERKGYARFGRTEIRPYDASLGGSEYLGKNVLSETGGIHFGGRLLDGGSNASPASPGRQVVARSADLPTAFFRLTLGKRRLR